MTHVPGIKINYKCRVIKILVIDLEATIQTNGQSLEVQAHAYRKGIFNRDAKTISRNTNSLINTQ